jgi:hypothetical protein
VVAMKRAQGQKTDFETERARAIDEGYAVVKP